MDTSLLATIHETDNYLNYVYNGCRHVISLYQWIPMEGALNLRYFQEIAAKRLALLQFIDENYQRGKIRTSSDHSGSHNEYKATADNSNSIEYRMEELGFALSKASTFQSSKEERLKLAQTDIISHFILRLSFSKDFNKKEWFLRQESRLLEFRLEHFKGSRLINTDGVPNLEIMLAREGINYKTIQRPNVIDGLLFSSPEYQLWSHFTYQKKDSDSVSKLYLVPFYPDGLNLVKNHKVALNNMFAYVPYSLLVQAIVTRFKHMLNKSFEMLDNNLELLESEIFADERLGSFLNALPSTYLAKDYDKQIDIEDGTKLSIANIHKLYRSTFPPCMRRIFEQYLCDGAMKHWARQQFWLFCKGAGMSLNESLTFNRSIWSNAANFDKEHMYGQEGRRVAYTPYSCSKIISVLPIPSGGSTHGCPFKLYDKKGLSKLLKGYGLDDAQLQPILEYTSTHQYQLACVEYFLQTHSNSSGDGVGNHPNAFFNAAIKSLSKPAEEEKKSARTNE